MINVNSKRCPQNHRCPALRVCQFDAISQNGFGLPQIDHDKCSECGTCVSFCPMGAIGEE